MDDRIKAVAQAICHPERKEWPPDFNESKL